MRGRDLIVGALRIAAMAQLGPIASGLLIAGGAVVGKILAGKHDLDALGEVVMELASDVAGKLFDSARAGLLQGHGDDLKRSMHEAAKKAFAEMGRESPKEFTDWIKAWCRFLTLRPPQEVFASVPDVDATMLDYDDARFRALWWSRMEPVLLDWRKREDSEFTTLHLEDGKLPEELASLLRDSLPERMAVAHEEVLRDEKLRRSWIAFQQRVYNELLGTLKIIVGGQEKILDLLQEILDRLAGMAQEEAPVWTIPQPNNLFHDRAELIAKIDEALISNRRTVLTALHGLGGIGKTQMARRFAGLRRDDYKIGIWIEAESGASLLASLSSLARRLGLPEEPDQQALAVRVLEKVSTIEPYLAIFDNAESPDAVRKWASKLTGCGTVLITSRNAHWEEMARAVSVETWSADESVQFLLARTKQMDQDSALKLAGDLDGLALALEHAAAYMARSGTSIEQYRSVWAEKLKWAAKGSEYPASVAAAIGLSVDAVQKSCPVAYELLSLFSWLAPDLIPKRELLEAGATWMQASPAWQALKDSEAWGDVLVALESHSLIARVQIDGLDTGYLVHRIVQQVVRDRHIAERKWGKWLDSASWLLDRTFPNASDGPETWPDCEALLPHVRAIRQLSPKSCHRTTLVVVFRRTAAYLNKRAQYSEAVEFLMAAIQSAEPRLGPDHYLILDCREDLADVLRELGRFTEAREQAELALQGALRHHDGDEYSARIASCRFRLAVILNCLGDITGARREMELVIDCDEQRLGKYHAVYEAELLALVHLLGDKAVHLKVRESTERALQSALQEFGPDHPNVATARHNLASVLEELGEVPEARRQQELALESLLKSFGANHPDVAHSRLRLAIILQRLDDFPRARVELKLALESDLLNFGPENHRIGVDRLNLAAVLNRIGENRDALAEITQAVEIFRKTLPAAHFYTTNAEEWHATILREAGSK
jgi:tetratricopeptide (TPR) repeat protein